jgi:hypothetical protein
VWAGALAVALALTWSGGGAWAQDDDEDLPLDTKLMRQFLKDLGLMRDGSGIEYRERAPLVVPPSRVLPPPQSAAAITSNPAWPKDPDVKQRKADAAKKKQPIKSASDTWEAERNPLPRSELEKDRLPAGTASGGSPSPEEGSRPLRPSELGSKGVFGGLFSSPFSKTETATFTGEPPRSSLTAPPPGYLTPSPNQPYGLGPATNQKKAITLEDRTATEGR